MREVYAPKRGYCIMMIIHIVNTRKENASCIRITAVQGETTFKHALNVCHHQDYSPIIYIRKIIIERYE